MSSKLHTHQEIKGWNETSAPTTVLDFGMVLGFLCNHSEGLIVFFLVVRSVVPESCIVSQFMVRTCILVRVIFLLSLDVTEFMKSVYSKYLAGSLECGMHLFSRFGLVKIDSKSNTSAEIALGGESLPATF